MSEDRVPLIELKQEQIALRLKKLEQELKPKKDLWDIIGATTPLITGLLISGIGLYFAYSNNLAQLKLQETQTIEKFIPHLQGSENEKKAAILALSSLVSTETAAKYAELFPSEGTASALKSIANSSVQEHDKAVANKALVNTFHKMADNYQAAQQPTQAAQASAQALAAQEKSVEADSPELLGSLNQLVDAYTADHKYALAESALKRILKIQKNSSGNRSPEFIATLNKLASVFKLDSNPDAAEHLTDYATLLTQQKVNPPAENPAPPVETVQPPEISTINKTPDNQEATDNAPSAPKDKDNPIEIHAEAPQNNVNKIDSEPAPQVNPKSLTTAVPVHANM